MSFDALAESCKSLLAMPTVCPNTGSIPAVSGTSVDVDKPPSFQFVSVSPKIERKPLAVPLMFGPNITGYTGAAWDDLSGDVTGAFYFSKNATEAGNGLSGYWGISFDASRVTSAYGRSSTVQPASTRLLYCIKS